MQKRENLNIINQATKSKKGFNFFILLSVSFVFCSMFIGVHVASADNYVITPATLFDDFETGWTKSSAAGTVTQNSVDFFKTGTGSIKLVSDGTTKVVNADKVISSSFQNAGTIAFWVYVPTTTDLSETTAVFLYVSSVTNFAKYFAEQVNGTALHTGWNYIALSKNSFTNFGTESWNNTMIRLRVKLTSSSGTPTIYFDSLYTSGFSRPKVIFTFDDGWDSQYSEAYAYMHSKNLKGIIYVIADLVDTAGKVTTNNLQEIYDAGWDLGTHGVTTLTTLADEPAQETEIAHNRQYLIDHSFTRAMDHYAYPGGQYNSDSLTALANLGFLTARTTLDRNQANMIDERYQLTRYGVSNTTTLAAVKAQVDYAVNTGESVWLNYHILVPSNADISTKSLNSNFEALVDYVKSYVDQGLVDVVTANEWYNGLTDVAPPADFTPTISPAITNGNSATVTFTTTDPSGISKYSIKVDDGTYTDNVTSPYTLDISSLTDGTHTITIKATDGANNIKEMGVNILIDRISPASVGVPTFGTIATSSIQIIKPAAVTENGSGLYQWQARKNGSVELGLSATTTVSITDTSLSENTQYTYDAQFKDYANNLSNYGTSAQKYTLADTPINLTGTPSQTGMSLSVNLLVNDTLGQSGYKFTNTITNNTSDWITINSWSDTGLTCGTTYSYSVTYRNGDGVPTSPTIASFSTSACPVVTADGNGAPVGLIGQHRQDVSNFISTTTNLTSLQNQIAQLTAQLNSLQSQKKLTTGNTQNNFVRNLSLHTTGSDIKLLQQYLNTHGFVIATSGAGSLGNETTLFGSFTFKALQKFQKSVGLPATGFFGPMTREYVNKK